MRYVAAVAVTGLTLALAGGQPGQAQPENPRTVTLLTGDQVSLADPEGRHLAVRPGPGREGMRFAVVRGGGGVYVVPADAMARIRSGAVDRRRFEVTGSAEPEAAAYEEEGYDLTIRYLDRDGLPTQDAFAVVSGWDRAVVEWPLVDPDGTSTVRLPKGRYNLGAFLGSGPDTALMVQPVLDLTSDRTVVLDARQTAPVSLTVPEPSARLGFVDVGYSFYPAYQSWPGGLQLFGDHTSEPRVGQIGAATPPGALTGSIAAQWAKPDGSGDFADSPYLYAVSETFQGRLPNGFSRDYRLAEFASVRQHFATASQSQSAVRLMWPSTTPALGSVSALNVPTALPGNRIEYLHTGSRWTSELFLGVRDGDGRFLPQGRLYQEPTAFDPGRSYRDDWNGGPAGPAFGQEGESAWQWASRTGDRIDVALPLYGDRAGHAGTFTATDSSRTSLYRDGVLVGEFPMSGRGSFTVPPEPAGYRLEVADTRGTGDLTTALRAAWTFRSGSTSEVVKLPLSAIRFTPRLDADDSAPAGRVFEVPVTIEGQPGSPAAQWRKLSVEISYDDGATWSKALLRKVSGDSWVAAVRHPGRAGHASLRASATDAAGNLVTETIIHAYRLKLSI